MVPATEEILAWRYLERSVDKVLEELNLDWHDKDLLLKNYTRVLLQDLLSKRHNANYTLGILKDLCIELYYEKKLFDFYLLYYALDDLKYSDTQYYWKNSDRLSIDEDIISYAKEWLTKNK